MAAVPGVVPGLGEVGLDALTGEIAKGVLGRDDFPYADYAGLFRELPQQGHGHIGFNVVLAHVAGVAAVVLQELRHVVHVAGQVDGHRHRAAGVDRGIRGGIHGRLLSLLNRRNELVEMRPQDGVRLLLLLRHGEALWPVTVAVDYGHGYGQGYERREDSQQGEQSLAAHRQLLLRCQQAFSRGIRVVLTLCVEGLRSLYTNRLYRRMTDLQRNWAFTTHTW